MLTASMCCAEHCTRVKIRNWGRHFPALQSSQSNMKLSPWDSLTPRGSLDGPLRAVKTILRLGACKYVLHLPGDTVHGLCEIFETFTSKFNSQYFEKHSSGRKGFGWWGYNNIDNLMLELTISYRHNQEL